MNGFTPLQSAVIKVLNIKHQNNETIIKKDLCDVVCARNPEYTRIEIWQVAMELVKQEHAVLHAYWEVELRKCIDLPAEVE